MFELGDAREAFRVRIIHRSNALELRHARQVLMPEFQRPIGQPPEAVFKVLVNWTGEDQMPEGQFLADILETYAQAHRDVRVTQHFLEHLGIAVPPA